MAGTLGLVILLCWHHGRTQCPQLAQEDTPEVWLLLLFLGTNWTTIFLGIEERYQEADPADVLGFRSLNVIVDSMIILVAVVLAFFLVGAIVAARRVAKIPTIRLVSTKQPPELSIVRGLTWHLFNSHIW